MLSLLYWDVLKMCDGGDGGAGGAGAWLYVSEEHCDNNTPTPWHNSSRALRVLNCFMPR